MNYIHSLITLSEIQYIGVLQKSVKWLWIEKTTFDSEICRSCHIQALHYGV